MDLSKNDQYWTNRHINWEEAYFTPDHPHRQKIISILKRHPVKSVLEIGCGCGANLYLIKKEFPEIAVAGCDINEDAIRTATKMFQGVESKHTPRKYQENPIREERKELLGEQCVSNLVLKDIELKVGTAEHLPFNGESFDLVLTDACLIYIDPKRMKRVLREIRRVGYNKMMFVEFHSKSWLKRLGLRMMSRYYAYDYKRLLNEDYFKYINFNKISEEEWGYPWGGEKGFGYIITCLR